MIHTHASYLVKTPSDVYYFQMRIPNALKQGNQVKGNLFRKSLKTKDERVAIKQARILYYAIDDVLSYQDRQDEAYTQIQSI
ncbi:MAG: hypothetical protein HQL46_16380 [Gammaproteobacteria bacterium]|nr:hypothetical protein [Gammaproteobacteria bacterium]